MASIPSTNADDLTGRALDAAVARHFGLEVEERTNARQASGISCVASPGGLEPVAFYGSLSASLKLQLSLADLTWKLKPRRSVGTPIRPAQSSSRS
jgi:hypothetical protein